ncbi:SIS domain-containing protein [Subtercola vilae]|uniref:Glutamine--fructose-6-phosphate aminotransferase [isomerizing] n=1 Tax=Subtercola vilae TaxID=2056433 RepID=A0A4T2C9Q7_9MICO|nr:SIS domain-containing protein [Subtercola vilae]TIH40151.1 SIS domain-containing protein [Subtercola vilae]
MTANTPFEADIEAQPDALRALAGAATPSGLRELDPQSFSRIVFTGMGSSHFVGIPTWRNLTAKGRPAWAIDTGQLLDTPGLLTPDTLLVITSQSGASGEVVALLDRLEEDPARPRTIVGITADSNSPLAETAELFLPLHSGPEATVSTKSYLNSLVVHAQLAAALNGRNVSAVNHEADRLAGIVTRLLTSTDTAETAATTLDGERPRVAAVGWRDDAATALFAGLITKESSKVAIEGHIGGQFRHGPFELAGPGLTVFLYGAHAASDDGSIARLASDLAATGAHAVLIGDMVLAGTTTIRASASTSLEGLVTGSIVAQLIARDLALENGVVPGAFAYGSKVTTAL